MLGGTGVGKSTLSNQLLGGLHIFKVGHGGKNLSSETSEIKIWTGQYLGTGRCVTIVDTPGFGDTQGFFFFFSLDGS